MDLKECKKGDLLTCFPRITTGGGTHCTLERVSELKICNNVIEFINFDGKNTLYALINNQKKLLAISWYMFERYSILPEELFRI